MSQLGRYFREWSGQNMYYHVCKYYERTEKERKKEYSHVCACYCWYTTQHA